MSREWEFYDGWGDNPQPVQFRDEVEAPARRGEHACELCGQLTDGWPGLCPNCNREVAKLYDEWVRLG